MRKIKVSGWGILSTLFMLLIVLPNLDVFFHLFQKPNENWNHIKIFLLKDYTINTLQIAGAVAVLTFVFGTSLAWLVVAYEFPMRKLFRWALILPLAIPPYIAAYTYAGMLSYTGGIQTFLRNQLNLTINQKYFDMMSIPGAIFIFTLFLLPYVYMIVKSYLEKQSASFIENARLLGESGLGVFFKVVIPMSRGVIVGGVTLVVLEVLSDYGVVSYFGIPTFSTAIFTSWFNMSDIDSALRLAALLLVGVLGVMLFEKLLRGRRKYSATNSKIRPISRKKLGKVQGIFAAMYCSLFLGLGFVVPTLQLMSWMIVSFQKVASINIVTYIYNSLWLAVVSSALVISMSLIIAQYTRLSESYVAKLYSKLTLIGYSIPGAVIAITMLLFFVDIDKQLAWFYKLINPNAPTLLLSMSVVMLVVAYVIRFLAVGYQSVEGGFDKVGKKFYEASRTLGYSTTQTFWHIDLPMLKPALLSGFALVFVDIIKELPLALILRPFNFNTLATKVFEYANDEMIIEASLPSLIIIGVTVVAILTLNKTVDKEDESCT